MPVSTWRERVSIHNISFSFICVHVEHEILSQKFSVTDCVPWSLNTEPKKYYWKKFEILGLVCGSLTTMLVSGWAGSISKGFIKGEK